MTKSAKYDSLELTLKSLKLNTMREEYSKQANAAEQNNWSYPQYLFSLSQIELDDRAQRKKQRNRTMSRIPIEKTRTNIKLEHYPSTIRKRFEDLCTGSFLEKAENILAFGLPGVGKTHYLCAIGHELINNGYRVFFTPAFQLVEMLLKAKKELLLERILKRLDSFDAVIIDDIGYIQQDRHQTEVLFTFLSERYERKSVMISSNLVFSEWGKIFLDAMTTAAAIDRLVHHSQVLEFNNDSYRAKIAKDKIKLRGKSIKK